MRGRVFGLMMAVAYAAAPVGMILTGYLVEAISVTTTLLIIGALYVTVTTVQFLNPALREMDKRRRPVVEGDRPPDPPQHRDFTFS